MAQINYVSRNQLHCTANLNLAWCVIRQNIVGHCQQTFHFYSAYIFSWSCFVSCWIGSKIQILQNCCMTKPSDSMKHNSGDLSVNQFLAWLTLLSMGFVTWHTMQFLNQPSPLGNRVDKWTCLTVAKIIQYYIYRLLIFKSKWGKGIKKLWIYIFKYRGGFKKDIFLWYAMFVILLGGNFQYIDLW